MKLRTKTTVLVIAAAAAVLPISATRASEFHEQRDSHPVRIVTRLAFPIARAFEWAVFRPFEYLTSRNHADVLFGNMEHVSAEKSYFEWSHGDFTPSIAEKRNAMKPAQPSKAKDAPTAAGSK